MTTRILLTVAILVLSLVSLTPAYACPTLTYDPGFGWVAVECTGKETVNPGSSPESALGQSQGRGERQCSFGERTVQCVTGQGTWFDSVSAWCRAMDPQPAYGDPVWGGRTTGGIWICTRAGFDGMPDPNLSNSMWLDRAASSALPPPDPVELAWRAVASLQLEPPSMGMFPAPLSQDPNAMSYVGWNNWLWVEDPGPQTWGPASASASDRGYTVTIQASVSHTDWDMGNGDVVRCQKGMKHPPSAVRNEVSPQCGYMYEVEGIYQVSATTFWQIDWSGVGRSGTLELELTGTEELLVGEVQVVNVPVNQR